eukprot:scaffold7330_cov146-Cylindrotheca_fusiformis.AAC.8
MIIRVFFPHSSTKYVRILRYGLFYLLPTCYARSPEPGRRRFAGTGRTVSHTTMSRSANQNEVGNQQRLIVAYPKTHTIGTTTDMLHPCWMASPYDNQIGTATRWLRCTIRE